MLEKEFQKLGLNQNEREVYLAVLYAKKAAPARISRETGINRTTVYSISRKLIALGLIFEDLGAKTAYLCAESPAALEKLFEKEAEQLEQKRILAREVAKELALLPSKETFSIPRVRFIEEADLSNYLYKAYPTWAKSGEKYENTWYGYHDDSFTKRYSDWVDWCWEQEPKELKVRLLSNQDQIEVDMQKKHPERLLRPLPKGLEFDSSLWVVGDFVIMVQTRERPHYLVEIHDAVFARNQRQLFKTFWE